MTSKNRAERCVTHHYACDCREYRYEQMESALKVISTWMDLGIQNGMVAAAPEHILALCKRALGIEK
ncbi:MAG: hypothetical protein RBT11_19255 [Desulfobacterales bacterium]|nr:hypothetical protein [Desulfobacterales bacterium]